MNLEQRLDIRYAAKNFDPSKEVTQEQLQIIKEILTKTPSSLNLQPWKFLIVESDEAKEKLAQTTSGLFEFNKHKVEAAPLTIVFCAKDDLTEADIKAVNDKEGLDGRYATKEIQEDMLNRLLNIHEKHLEIYGDWKDENKAQAYIAVGFFLMAIADLELDAVPIGGFNKQELNESFGLTKQGYSSVALVSIGHHSEDDFNAKLPKSRLDNVIEEL